MAVVCLVALTITGCSSPTAPTATDAVRTPPAGGVAGSANAPRSVAAAGNGGSRAGTERPAATVTLCHRTDSGRYVLATINANAEAGHRAHGDAAIDEPVPGEEGMVFSSHCVPTAVMPTNPPALPPPSLALSATSVTAGTAVTATLAGADGSAANWLALAEAGSPDSSFVQQIVLSAGVTHFPWTVSMGARGTYEFRFFSAANRRLATSAPVVVDVGGPTLIVDVPTAPVGTPVTVTLQNAPGGATDWLALATTGSSDTTYWVWTYVGAGVTTRSWTVTMPATGSYEFRLFLNDGYTRAATSPTVTVTPPLEPSLSVDTIRAAPGGAVTVTVANAPGGSTDWLALAANGAPLTSYLQWTYVGSGVATRTWTVSMPAAAGTYEFRLFLNNGYVLAATSPPVSVGP